MVEIFHNHSRLFFCLKDWAARARPSLQKHQRGRRLNLRGCPAPPGRPRSRGHFPAASPGPHPPKGRERTPPHTARARARRPPLQGPRRRAGRAAGASRRKRSGDGRRPRGSGAAAAAGLRATHPDAGSAGHRRSGTRAVASSLPPQPGSEPLRPRLAEQPRNSRGALRRAGRSLGASAHARRGYERPAPPADDVTGYERPAPPR